MPIYKKELILHLPYLVLLILVGCAINSRNSIISDRPLNDEPRERVLASIRLRGPIGEGVNYPFLIVYADKKVLSGEMGREVYCETGTIDSHELKKILDSLHRLPKGPDIFFADLPSLRTRFVGTDGLSVVEWERPLLESEPEAKALETLISRFPINNRSSRQKITLEKLLNLEQSVK